MKLSDFISTHDQEILQEWEAFARTLLPAVDAMSSAGLRDHASEIRAAIVIDCGYRSMPITDSGASRSLIPVEADHRFRSKPIAERTAS
jgi:hypothetical protein